ARAGERRADGRRAREKILVPQIVEVAFRRDVPGLRRARLEQARQLRGGGNVDRRRVRRTRLALLRDHAVTAVDVTDRTRSSRRSTIAPATSTPVARWSPCQPGMPFTSRTNTPPSLDGARSTPA